MNGLDKQTIDSVLSTLLEEIHEQAKNYASIVSIVDTLSADVARLLKLTYGMNGDKGVITQLALIEHMLNELSIQHPPRPCNELIEYLAERKQVRSSSFKNWLTIISIAISLGVGLAGIILSL